TMEQLADQTLLIGGLFEKGIHYLNPQTNTFEPYPVPGFVGNFSVHSIFEDSQQRLWVGTSPRGKRGLYVRENDVWELVAGKENVPYATYQYIMETPGGDIWASARGEGLIRYDGTSYFHYSTRDGLSSDFIRGLYAYTDSETGKEWLFIGSEGDGLDIVQLKDGAPDFSSLVTLNEANGLYHNSIHVILEDDFDRFWMNTNQGIFWITKQDVHAFLRGETETITSTSYTEKDGLAHREGNGGTQPSAIKAFDGTLWFAGQGGAVSVDPANITKNHTAPPIHIQHIGWQGGNVEYTGEELHLNANQRDFEITYAALSFLQPEKNQYRYRLDGFHDRRENEWHYIGNRRTAYFTNVPAGTYTFRVQGSNNDGVWSAGEATVTITIAPLFYETGWFKVLATGSVITFVFLILAIREKRGIRSQQKLEHIISQRTDDLRKEKEEVEHQKEEIERQKEIIDELSSAKDNFFTNISHELRTPLTLVLGPLQSLAHDNTDMPRKWKHNLELAQRNGFRLKQLVDQVLDLARLESGKIEINPVKLDVGAKVAIIMASFESIAGNKNIILKTSVPGQKVCAGVDPDKFQKILTNLISNAIKFTPEKGAIEVDVRVNEEFVELAVSDTGIGIQKDRIPYIFDRFHSKEGEITGGGYGLGVGLNLTKELVELHGGRITVNSEYGKGSTFLVTLRSCPKTMAKEGAPVVDENEDIPTFDTPLQIAPFFPKNATDITTNILLVEDNPDMRQYISSLLSANNLEVTEAENGLEGKKKLALINPDVIISDVMMPDMDGFEFSRYVRSVPEH
ncbi:MAG: ATP-binding protein, partial [Balneolales bacterium]|nr:ATP-binding protein [Balneolales bacterium]